MSMYTYVHMYMDKQAAKRVLFIEVISFEGVLSTCPEYVS